MQAQNTPLCLSLSLCYSLPFAECCQQSLHQASESPAASSTWSQSSCWGSSHWLSVCCQARRAISHLEKVGRLLWLHHCLLFPLQEGKQTGSRRVCAGMCCILITGVLPVCKWAETGIPLTLFPSSWEQNWLLCVHYKNREKGQVRTRRNVESKTETRPKQKLRDQNQLQLRARQCQGWENEI